MNGSFIWCIVAAIAWGICPILERVGLLKLTPAAVLFIQSATVSCIIGLYLLFEKKDGETLFQYSSLSSIALVAFCALLGSLLGEYAYLRSIMSGETAKAVAITSAYPLITVALSVGLLGESVSLSGGLGTLLIVCGVYCLSIS